MPYSNETIEQQRQEKETQAYKMFTRVAKKVMRLEYGKWQMSPDLNDPIRKVVLSRDIGLATLYLTLYMRDFYHRGVWDDSRYDWKPQLAVGGLQQKTCHEDGIIRTSIKVGPRAAKKILEFVNTEVIPKFYKDIQDEKAAQEAQRSTDAKWRTDIAKVRGLKSTINANSWDRTPTGELSGCPFHLKLHTDGVRLESPVMSYDQLADMAYKMGWGK